MKLSAHRLGFGWNARLVLAGVMLLLGTGVGRAQYIVVMEAQDGSLSVANNAGSVTVNVWLLGGPYAETVTVQYGTGDGTATSPNDYVANLGTLVFPPGQTTTQIVVSINPVSQPGMYFYVWTSLAQYGDGVPNSGNATTIVTIVDAPSPPPTVQFEYANYYACERSGSATITVTLSAASASTVTVSYATSDGTATAGLDYDATSGALTFAPGVTSQTFTVGIIPDLLAEGDETVQLTLSSPSGATLGTQATATLNIWDCPPVLTVTAATNPICAGALQTPVHQTAINVSLTDGGGGFAGIPLTLSTSAGSLANTSGTTDASGAFTTTLTSNHWASGVSIAYTATITVVADGVLTATTTVTFNPTSVALSADVTTIPPGGVAHLTAALTFQGQPVAGHHLHWSIAGIWDGSGKQVYNGAGTVPPGYGHIESGASTTTDSSGGGTAVWKAGHNAGKVKIKVSDESVRIEPDGANPQGQVLLQEPKERVSLWADVNRDGKIDDGDKSEKLKLDSGTILIADQDGVYADKEYPARRREIQVKTDAAGAKVVVKRSSTNLLLYNAKTAGAELFGKNDDVKLTPGTSYWLQAGALASNSVRDQSLQARPDAAGAAFQDKVNVTVVWVEIKGYGAPGKLKPKNIYGGEPNVLAWTGRDDLGVFRNVKPKTPVKGIPRLVPGLAAFGTIEIDGKITPNDFAFPGGETQGFTFTDNKENTDARASAKFGFVFKRKVTYKDYKEGNDVNRPYKSATDQNDDSERKFQDVQPKRAGQNLLIVDADAPNATVYPSGKGGTYFGRSFAHARANFVEKIVFHFDHTPLAGGKFAPGAPERAAKAFDWAVTLDAALNTDKELAFILAMPNTGKKHNAVLVGEHLPNLDATFALPKIDSAQNPFTKDQKIKISNSEIIAVKGTNLIGYVSLRDKEGQVIPAYGVEVHYDDSTLYSDATRISALFKTTNKAPSGGWELVIKNSAGAAKAPTAFEIVK